MKKKIISVMIIFLSFIISSKPTSREIINKKEKKEVIVKIRKMLVDQYIFPDIAVDIKKLINENIHNGIYDSYTDPRTFAKRLTNDLQSISQDKHLRVRFDPERVRELLAEESQPKLNKVPKAYLERMRRVNYGFMEARILQGNIGYLDIRGFVDIEYGAETAVAAMNFLMNADALIIDLRRCGGGRPSMVQLVASYLFESNPVHLNDFYFRPTNSTTQSWTLPYIPGKRRPDIDVYLLISKRTFSAGEGFAYSLRSLKRATLIGESTRGGAHPGGERIINNRFYIWIPTGRSVNPITKKNWEGTGVFPHVAVPADQALEIAHLMALKKITENCKEDYLKNKYKEYIKKLEKK
jgi:hypothetical protein